MFDDTVSMMTLNDEDILGSNDAGVPGFVRLSYPACLFIPLTCCALEEDEVR